MNEIDKIVQELVRNKVPKPERSRSRDLLSSGSTLVNLAVSGDYRGAFQKGKYYHLVGTSDSGKTFLTLTSFAEAGLNKHFANHRFIHDNPEDGSLMDMTKFFGKAVNDRIEPPRGTRDDPIFSSTIEEFYYAMDDAFKAKKPFIYVLDSLDALDADPDRKKFIAHKAANRKTQKSGEKSKEEAGSYGTAKAKMNSAGMRVVFNKLKKSESILIIISQAKADMRFGAPIGAQTFSGGTSLKYYCHGQIWTSMGGAIKKTVKEKSRDLGINAIVKVKKNRHTGRKTDVRVPIYWATGMDDTGSCVDYLIEEGHWTAKEKVGVNATEFGVTVPKEKLIALIEQENEEPKLRKIVAAVWEEVRLACVPDRKMRYGQQE